MITMMEYLGFIVLTILLYLPVLWARWAFGVANYYKRKLGTISFYNLIPIFFHAVFWGSGEILLYGPIDSSLLRWLSPPMILLHLLTAPSHWMKPKFFVRNRFDPRIRK